MTDDLDRTTARVHHRRGPAGLATARALRARGLDYDQFERNTDVGGIWDIDAPGSPMYEAAHFISSKTMSGFGGFPMSDDLPGLPIAPPGACPTCGISPTPTTYATASTFSTSVEQRDQARRRDLAGGPAGRARRPVPRGGLLLRRPMGTEHAAGARVVQRRSAAQQRVSRPRPDPREAGVGGRWRELGLRHRCRRRPGCRAGRISMRRGYWFIPKHVFGVPSDVFRRQWTEVADLAGATGFRHIAEPALRQTGEAGIAEAGPQTLRDAPRAEQQPVPQPAARRRHRKARHHHHVRARLSPSSTAAARTST